MKRIAVILYGPPGSGKSTQADLVARATGLIRIDTGKLMEEKIYDPANANDAYIQEQRTLFEGGKWCDPKWAYEIVTDKIKQLASVGSGIVLAGSPKTLEEAFGAAAHGGMYGVLEEKYGKENIFTFYLEMKHDLSVTRNANRLVCDVCLNQFLPSKMISRETPTCPICGGPLKKRSLDKPDVISLRVQEFKKRTEPIIQKIKERGYAIHAIDGEQPPYKVLADIKQWLS